MDFEAIPNCFHLQHVGSVHRGVLARAEQLSSSLALEALFKDFAALTVAVTFQASSQAMPWYLPASIILFSLCKPQILLVVKSLAQETTFISSHLMWPSPGPHIMHFGSVNYSNLPVCSYYNSLFANTAFKPKSDQEQCHEHAVTRVHIPPTARRANWEHPILVNSRRAQSTCCIWVFCLPNASQGLVPGRSLKHGL